MSSYPSKLNLSQNEIKHIHTQFRNILNEKVRLHLPHHSQELTDNNGDTIERQVLLEIDKFLTSVMEMANDSVHVTDAHSGINLVDVISDVNKEYTEPFDVELNEQVRKLYQEWESETVKVTQLHRNGPQRILDSYRKEENEILEDVETRLNKLEQEAVVSDSIIHHEDIPNTIMDDYKGSLEMLQKASELLPRDRKKLEKLKRLVLYIESEV